MRTVEEIDKEIEELEAKRKEIFERLYPLYEERRKSNYADVYAMVGRCYNEDMHSETDCAGETFKSVHFYRIDRVEDANNGGDFKFYMTYVNVSDDYLTIGKDVNTATNTPFVGIMIEIPKENFDKIYEYALQELTKTKN